MIFKFRANFTLLLFLWLIGDAGVFAAHTSKSKFRADLKDGFSFIKQNLLYQAFDNAIREKLKALGYDYVKYYQVLNEKVEKQFQVRKKNIEARYGKKLSAVRQQELQQALRKEQFELRLRLNPLYRSVKKYNFEKKVKRIKKTPKSKIYTAVIKTEIDSTGLSRLYNQFLQQNSLNASVVRLKVDFQLESKDFEWLSLGVKDDAQRKQQVIDFWEKNWRDYRDGLSVSLVQDEPKDPELETDKLEKSFEDGSAETNSEASEGDGAVSGPDYDFRLAVSTVVDPVSLDPQRNDYRFGIDSVIELLNKKGRVLYSFQFPTLFRNYSRMRKDQVAEKLFSSMARIPVEKFIPLRKVILRSQKKTDQKVLHVTYKQRFDRVLTLIELLNRYGVELRLEAKFDKLEKQKATVLVSFDGKVAALSGVLKRIATNHREIPIQFVTKTFPLEITIN